MADPNQPVAQILRRPRKTHIPQNKKNIQCPSFFFPLKPNSTTPDLFSKNPLMRLLVLLPWMFTLWLTWWRWWCFLSKAEEVESNPSGETGLVPISDLGEPIWTSISWWVLKVVVLPLPPLVPLLLVLLLVLLLLLLFSLLLRLNEWARRVIGPEKRGLLTLCDMPSLELWWWWWWPITLFVFFSV